MKIIYGVAGEGSGHASRAKEMADHLLAQGHQVKIVSYDRGYQNLKSDFDCIEVEGLHIVSQDNKVSLVKTFTENLKKLPSGHRSLKVLKALFKSFQPDCVLCDFEPMTAYLANHYHVPLISVDNQHRMRYMAYDAPADLRKERLLTENVIRLMVPKPDVSLITTFYFGDVTNDRSFLFPPILRREVLSLTPTIGAHILVYLTQGYDACISLLAAFTREKFIVYGYSREEQVNNIQFKQFSQSGFLTDLAQAKAVMATAGFTLMTEAVFLKKPYFAMPMAGQFEQQINAHWLQQLHYGVDVSNINADVIASFLYHLPDFRAQLADYAYVDNTEIEAKLDALLANDAALLKQFHTQR